MNQSFRETASALAAISRSFYTRGWALGTSGNFSAVVSRDPLRIAITPSGADKGELTPEQILEIGSDVNEADGRNTKPSAEALLHINVILQRDAGAVLHTAFDVEHDRFCEARHCRRSDDRGIRNVKRACGGNEP